MKELAQAYTDGAFVAYKDVSHYVRELFAKTPPDIVNAEPLLGIVLNSIADACDTKARTVRQEADKFMTILNGGPTDA